MKRLLEGYERAGSWMGPLHGYFIGARITKNSIRKIKFKIQTISFI